MLQRELERVSFVKIHGNRVSGDDYKPVVYYLNRYLNPLLCAEYSARVEE